MVSFLLSPASRQFFYGTLFSEFLDNISLWQFLTLSFSFTSVNNSFSELNLTLLSLPGRRHSKYQILDFLAIFCNFISISNLRRKNLTKFKIKIHCSTEKCLCDGSMEKRAIYFFFHEFSFLVNTFVAV